MTRTMVYLPDEVHRNLKHLAIEQGTSLAELIREAVTVLYQEDLEDLKEGRKRLKEALDHPERLIPYHVYLARRAKRRRSSS